MWLAYPPIHPWAGSHLCLSLGSCLCKRHAFCYIEGQRFDLRFFRPFCDDLSIKKSSSFLPRLMAATSHLGFAPRPAQVLPERLRYFGGTFLPFNALPPPRTTLLPGANIFNCFSISARRSLRASSTRVCRSMSASTVIPDRFTFGITNPFRPFRP